MVHVHISPAHTVPDMTFQSLKENNHPQIWIQEMKIVDYLRFGATIRIGREMLCLPYAGNFADNCICYQGGYIEHTHANWECGKVVFLALNKYYYCLKYNLI